MKTTDPILIDIINFCKANADPVIVAKYARYFKEGYDAWGVSTEKILAFRNEIKPGLKDYSLDELIGLGDKLWASGKYEEGMFAIWLCIGRWKEYTPENFQRLGTWLDRYIINWAHTDALCSEVLPVYFDKNIVSLPDLDTWKTAESIWKRRAVPVTLIKPMKKGHDLTSILSYLDSMMMNTEKPIQQGLGWFLREAWKKQPAVVEPFLLKWKDECGRVIVQYACEKMSAEEKLKYRKTKGQTGR